MGDMSGRMMKYDRWKFYWLGMIHKRPDSYDDLFPLLLVLDRYVSENDSLGECMITEE
jgi:hypothetical protein